MKKSIQIYSNPYISLLIMGFKTSLFVLILVGQSVLANNPLLIPPIEINYKIDTYKPDNISDNKWSGLKSAVLQEAKLLPTPSGISGENSHFGQSVSIDGNRAIVGTPEAQDHGVAYVYYFDGSNWNLTDILAPLDSSNNDLFGITVSILGNRILVGDSSYDGTGTDSGAVYVFDFNGSNWAQTARLISTDIASGDQFGISVNLSNNRAVIGAQNDDDGGSRSGSAYIFDYDGSNWSQTQKLTASDAVNSDFFGNSVSLSGDRVLIGAKGNDDGGSSSGSAYIFDFDGNNWTESVKLLSLDDDSGDLFGTTVALLDNRAVIGAISDSIPAVTTASGAAYVFDFDGTVWQQTIKLLASDAGNSDSFGNSVSLSANRVLIGANRHEINPSFRDFGAAYVFDFDGTSWAESTIIVAADGDREDELGVSVHLTGDRLIVGAFKDDDNGFDSGSSYIYDFDGTNWLQTIKLTAPESSAGDQFGLSVSLDNDLAIVGSPFDDDLGSTSGSAYLYQFMAGNWSLVSKFSASDTSSGHQFGTSVDIDNTRIMIGSRSARNNSNASSGAVYVFDFDGSNWLETAKLLASDGTFGDLFGSSISLEGDRVIVGAEGDDINSSNRDAGATYIFDYDGTNWSQTTKLQAFDRRQRDYFGHSVGLSGDKVVVGSYRDDAGNLTDFGSAYVFDYDGSNWSHTTKLIANDAASSDVFGTSVSIFGTRIIIGASGDDDNGSSSGSAYIFDFDGTTWSQSGKLITSSPSNNQRFGHSVSLQNDQLVVGTSFSSAQGSAYVFDYDGTNWNQTGVLQPSGGLLNNFGNSVSLFGDKVIGGASMHNQHGTASGAAYVFDLTAFSVAGTVTGLASGNAVVLQNNFGDNTIVSANGSFKFNTGFLTGASYNVTVLTQPTAPNQTCDVNNGSGMINAIDITNVSIACTTNLYTIGLTVSGLASGNTATLQNNLGDDLIATGNGLFTFASALDDESVYDVTVLTQPTAPNQECVVSNGSDVLSGSNVVNIAVDCSTLQYTFSGNLTGLTTGNSIVLQNNLADDLLISANGNFVFSTALDDESSYSITVFTQPSNPNQSCLITGDSGTLVGADISNISIACTTIAYSVGGILSGLSVNNTLVLQNNMTDNSVLTTNGVFTFVTALDDISNYTVTVLTQPSAPNQTCLITGGNSGSNNGTGTLAGANESSIVVICNSEPVIINDNYSINEDTLLTANDANGSNNNQDGVLANDSDAEGNPLSIVSPGTYTLDGIGGLITINSDGTFVLIPSTDANGQASFDFEVTDGFHTLASSLTVDVSAVNDAPSFSILGDIDSIPLVVAQGTIIQIPQFAFDVVLGPANENTQAIQQYNLVVFSDFDNILNDISVTNDGTLSIDLTQNDGIANLGISLQDDGGTANNGDDTSSVIQFTLSYIDFVYADDFEEINNNKLFDFLDNMTASQANTIVPEYHHQLDSIVFNQEVQPLNGDYGTDRAMQRVKTWLYQVLIKFDPSGDFDSDGDTNTNDLTPFNQN